MRSLLVAACAVVFALLAFRIGDRAVEDNDRLEARGTTAIRQALTDRPHLAVASGTVICERGCEDVVALLTPLAGGPDLELALDDGWWTAAIIPGRYRLAVHAEGYLPAIALVDLPAEITTKLEPGGSIVRGRVRAATGLPVGGARVVFEDEHAVVIGVARSRPDGQFSTSLAGPYAVAAAHAVGFMSQRTGQGGELDFELTPGVEIQGVVTRADGEPCPQAKVRIEVEQGFTIGQFAVVHTDDTARFVVNLAEGVAAFTAVGPGCVADAPTRVVIDRPRAVHVVADRAYRIAGRVLGPQREPVAGAEISLSGTRMGGSATSQTDGTFELDGAPATELSLVVTHDDHEALEKVVAIRADHTGLELVLERARGRQLRGRVDPPMTARLTFDTSELELEDPRSRASGISAMTTADGTFSLRGVPDGDLVLLARSDDGWAGRAHITVRGDRDDVRVALTRNDASLVGRVIDQQGRPVAGARILVSEPDTIEPRHATSDAGGQFRFDHLAPGAPQLWLDDHRLIDLPELVLERSRTTSVTLVVARDTGVIRGRVVVDRGDASGVWVTADGGPDPHRVRTMTRDDGSFELAALRDDLEYSISIEAAQGDLAGDAVGRSGDTVTIHATRHDQVEVAVRRGGAPVRRFGLHCRSAGGGGLQTSVESADGTYRLALRPGDVTCYATSNGFGARVTSSTRRVELALEPLAILRGTGRPETFVTYRVGSEPPSSNPDDDYLRTYSESTQVAADGTFELRAFPGPGIVRVRDTSTGSQLWRPVNVAGAIDLGDLTID